MSSDLIIYLDPKYSLKWVAEVLTLPSEFFWTKNRCSKLLVGKISSVGLGQFEGTEQKGDDNGSLWVCLKYKHTYGQTGVHTSEVIPERRPQRVSCRSVCVHRLCLETKMKPKLAKRRLRKHKSRRRQRRQANCKAALLGGFSRRFCKAADVTVHSNLSIRSGNDPQKQPKKPWAVHHQSKKLMFD